MPCLPFRPLPPMIRDIRVAAASRSRALRCLRRARVALALCLAGLAPLSCASDSPDNLDELSCQGDVGSDCPATYDEVLAGTWTCQAAEMIVAGACATGGPPTLTRNFGTHQSNCFYDPTSHALVGANTVNDSKAYCNGTSASMSSGTIPVPYPYYCTPSSSTTDRSMSCSN